jgi:cell division protein ZapA
MSAPSTDVARVSVRILDKEYVIACPLEERAELLDSAAFLNARMRDVRDSAKVIGLDRIAVVVALNLANELVKIRGREEKTDADVGARLKGMRERVESALAQGQQLEL